MQSVATQWPRFARRLNPGDSNGWKKVCSAPIGIRERRVKSWTLPGQGRGRPMLPRKHGRHRRLLKRFRPGGKPEQNQDTAGPGSPSSLMEARAPSLVRQRHERRGDNRLTLSGRPRLDTVFVGRNSGLCSAGQPRAAVPPGPDDFEKCTRVDARAYIFNDWKLRAAATRLEIAGCE
jgi:hypothetical protein